MSASIYWRPKGGRRYLDLSAPSSFKDMFEQVFSEISGLELKESDLPALEVMIAVAEGEKKKCLKVLHTALSMHSEIVMGVEY